MSELTDTTATASYTSVDLNTTGTTTLLDPSTDTKVHGVWLKNGGGTAVVDLEITDGTNTATLENNAAGEGIVFGDAPTVPESVSLQANVTTAEGTAQTNTAVVLSSTP